MPYQNKYQQARAHKLWPGFVQTNEDDGEEFNLDEDNDEWFYVWEWFVAGAITEKLLQQEA